MHVRGWFLSAGFWTLTLHRCMAHAWSCTWTIPLVLLLLFFLAFRKKNTVGCASNMYIGKAEQRADAELRQVPRSNSRLRSPRFGDNPYAIYFRSPKLIFRGCARRVLTVRIVASGNRSALAAPRANKILFTSRSFWLTCTPWQILIQNIFFIASRHFRCCSFFESHRRLL